MESSRRKFLKLAGITAAGISAAPALTSFAKSHANEESHGGTPEGRIVDSKNALTAAHWGMVIDTRKLKTSRDLRPLIEACHSIHNVPEFDNEDHEIKWIWEEGYEHVFPTRENKYLSEKMERLPFLTLCNHCENPPCVRACPTKATFQREDGIVMMDFHRCIGCRFCMAACPYGSRSFNFRDPRPGLEEINEEFPTRMKGVVEKCNFCAERLAKGQMPACVEAADGAILFGDLGDPASDVRKALRENYTIRRNPSLGTEPSVYYIV
ncbi:MAG: 4Fe-4S dicluster domain-containing protein [Thermodesulfobacteriota bacterium]|nr:4Fe-4S dicluster domain-containing protein [Thermodesulfobacteriota bacterium]